MIRFEWDENKNRSNRRKHGVWFEEAQTVFVDEQMRCFYDPEHSSEEDRYIALGYSNANRLLVVAHCSRKSFMIRIISARRATVKERRFYEERI